jgi:predicted RNase H-like nuclease (RuvC/YqgF family)
MNLTLSADPELVARVRAYAQAHHTTLNQLIREYMETLIGQKNPEESARQFAELALQRAGRSPKGYRFNRRAVHKRS